MAIARVPLSASRPLVLAGWALSMHPPPLVRAQSPRAIPAAVQPGLTTHGILTQRVDDRFRYADLLRREGLPDAVLRCAGREVGECIVEAERGVQQPVRHPDEAADRNVARGNQCTKLVMVGCALSISSSSLCVSPESSCIEHPINALRCPLSTPSSIRFTV